MGRRRKRRTPKLDIKPETIHSIVAVVLIAMGILVIVSFSGQGELLRWINDKLAVLLGIAMLFLPFVFISAGMMMFKTKWAWSKPNVLLGTLLLMLGVLGTFRSGSIGDNTFLNVAKLLSNTGSYVFFVTLLIIGALIITQLSITEMLEGLTAIKALKKKPEGEGMVGAEEPAKPFGGFSLPKLSLGKKVANQPFSINKGAIDTPEAVDDSDTAIVPQAASQPAAATEDGELGDKLSTPSAAKMIWEYPPLSLLSSSEGGDADRGDIKANAQKIEDTLSSFSIKAKVAEVNYGPSVTQYALDITKGTKLSKITGLSTDLALALAAPGGQIRIEAPIAGRSLVGIEVPNHSAQFVTLRKMLTSPEMKKNPSKLAVALGINVAGQPMVMDIAKLPHILIAGATGSGKSVAINSFLCSMLFRASPDEVKFILVDPKRVELTGYNDIPHLLVPVIVEPKKVVAALNWATHEMDRRYKQLAEVGVRNIDAYNELAGYAAMYNIVIVIDELADIMLFSPAEVEESVTRIAQMARAVGIHLVLATQRPSVDVITGLIKANIPGRIAFNVSSMTDSRVILDTPGAEKLLGRGDMLYLPPDKAKPMRVQGTFVSDQEINNLIDFIKAQGQKPKYEEEITTKYTAAVGAGGAKTGAGAGDRDDLFDQTVEYIAKSGKATTSSIQRHFSIGYNRAGRIVDQLYAAGMVGPQIDSKPREINTTVIMEYLRSKGGAAE